jgi:prepilin-type processing-associated H-X9-DG protein
VRVDDPNEPIDVEVRRDEGMTVTFADGHVGRFDLTDLRAGCPCATCRSLRDHGDVAWPRPESPQPLRIEDAGFHGAWGIQVTWNDGHRTGIYPFDALRRWSEGQIAFGADSGLSEPSD